MDVGYMPREAKRGHVGSLEKPWASVVAESVVINLDGEYVPVGSTFVQKTNYEADQSRVSMLLSGLRTDVDVVTADARTTRESLPEFSDYTRTLLKQPSVEAWRASLAVPKIDGSDASGIWEIDISGNAYGAYTDDLGRIFSQTYLTLDTMQFDQLILTMTNPDTGQMVDESVLNLLRHPANDDKKVVQLSSTDVVLIASDVGSDDFSESIGTYGARFEVGTGIFGKQVLLLVSGGAAIVNPGGVVSSTGGFAVEMQLGTSAVLPGDGEVVGVYANEPERCTRATTTTPVVGICAHAENGFVSIIVSGITTARVAGTVTVGATLYVNANGVCTTSGSNKVGVALTPANADGYARILVRP